MLDYEEFWNELKKWLDSSIERVSKKEQEEEYIEHKVRLHVKLSTLQTMKDQIEKIELGI